MKDRVDFSVCLGGKTKGSNLATTAKTPRQTQPKGATVIDHPYLCGIDASCFPCVMLRNPTRRDTAAVHP